MSAPRSTRQLRVDALHLVSVGKLFSNLCGFLLHVAMILQYSIHLVPVVVSCTYPLDIFKA
jgi:hypothetical protein